jgi:hypothetical protein
MFSKNERQLNDKPACTWSLRESLISASCICELILMGGVRHCGWRGFPMGLTESMRVALSSFWKSSVYICIYLHIKNEL